MPELKDEKIITSQMIADLAYVSRATVSRVIKNEPYVKESVRKRVQTIIDEYGYKPNFAGRALVQHKRRVKIGVIGLNKKNSLYKEIYRGSLEAAEEYRSMAIEVLFRNVEDITHSSQIVNAVDELTASKIQGLALLGTDDEDVQKAIRSVDKSIPVVTFNTNISNIHELCYVGQNAQKSGRTAGALLGELVQEGNIVVIANSLKVLAVAERIRAFKKYIQESYRGLNIIGIYENRSSDELSYEIIKNISAKKEKIGGIYLASGFGSGGVCSAIEDQKLKNIRIVANDMLPDTVKNIKEGRIAFTIDQELKTQGYLPIDILAKYLLMGEKPKSKTVYTRIHIFNSQNI